MNDEAKGIHAGPAPLVRSPADILRLVVAAVVVLLVSRRVAVRRHARRVRLRPARRTRRPPRLDAHRDRRRHPRAHDRGPRRRAGCGPRSVHRWAAAAHDGARRRDRRGSSLALLGDLADVDAVRRRRDPTPTCGPHLRVVPDRRRHRRPRGRADRRCTLAEPVVAARRLGRRDRSRDHADTDVGDVVRFAPGSRGRVVRRCRRARRPRRAGRRRRRRHRSPPASPAVGLPLASIEPASVDARGSTPYFAVSRDGGRLFVKVLGHDERSADLLFRIYRRLQRRDLGDERPFSSLRRAVEHEALARPRRPRPRHPDAAAAGARRRPSRTRSCSPTTPSTAGRSTGSTRRASPTTCSLAIWQAIADLRRHGIAHRDLRLANVFLGADGEVWIIDFGFSEMAASDLLLANDVAELVASSSVYVGAERAVAPALATVDARHAGPRRRPAAAVGAERRDPHRAEATARPARRPPSATRRR